MGMASRHRWDQRAVEYFRIMKLDGEEAAERYKKTFLCSPCFIGAVNRLMARVVRYNQENPHARNQNEVQRGPSDVPPVPISGAEAPIENVGPTPG